MIHETEFINETNIFLEMDIGSKKFTVRLTHTLLWLYKSETERRGNKFIIEKLMQNHSKYKKTFSIWIENIRDENQFTWFHFHRQRQKLKQVF